MHRVLVFVVISLAAISLCGWTIHPLRGLIPHFPFWGTMKANNALMVLLCAVSITLSEPRRTKLAVKVSEVLANIAGILAAVLVFEAASGITLPFVDTWLAADAYSAHPGRVSIEGCGTLLLMAFVLRNLRVRKRTLSQLVDGATLAIVFMMLILTSRFVFGLVRLFGESPQHPLSLQTFLCLSILTWLLVNRRAEYGAFSVVIGSQIGGKTARFAAPCALFLPFAFAFAKTFLVQSHLLSEVSATATVTSSLSVFAFVLVLALGHKTNALENAIRELSLRDELTKLYNRRGFYVLAEQALRLAQRAGEPFFVLFIDVDELKKTNDALGHELGSELLRETAALIEHTFRETDVIGRIGGDEFVVAGRVEVGNSGNPVARLEEAVRQENAMPGRRFPIGFSLGFALSQAGRPETLEQLLQRSDAIMYEAKRTKKRLGAEAVAVPA
jgi:diguanylate cyclase (GGDEF)-like protein